MTMSGGRSGGTSSSGGSMESTSRGSMESSSLGKSGAGSSFEIKSVTDRKTGGSGDSFEIKSVTETPKTSSGSEFKIESVTAEKKGTTATGSSGGEVHGSRGKVAETTKVTDEKTEKTEKKTETKSGDELKGKEVFTGKKSTLETPKKAAETTKVTDEKTEKTEKKTETKSGDELKGKEVFTGKKSTLETPKKVAETTKVTDEKTEKVEKKAETREAKTELEKPAAVTETKEARETTEDFEKKAEAAMKEIKLKEYSEETLKQVEHECTTEKFRDGEGKEISKAEAVDAMVGDLDGALESLRAEGREISDEQKAAILEDARKAIYSQEAESQSRGIGSHGVSHIYGVYERTKDIPDEVLEQAAADVRERNPESKATAADMRAALIVAAVYHDEGYLSEQARMGPGKDGLHGVDSAIAFEHKHARVMDGAVDGAVLEDTRRAMAEHNVLPETPEEALKKAGVTEDSPVRREVLAEVATEKRADMDPNENFVRSALLLSDKLAVDADEKMPDVLRDEERARVMVSYYQQQADRVSEDERAQLKAQVEKDGMTGEAAAAELAKREKALLAEKNAGKPEEMKQRLSDMVRSDKSLTEDQKARYLAAIEKDINPGAGGFDLPMTGVTTPATALKFSVVEEGGRKHIEAEATIHHRVDDPIYMESFGDKTGPGAPKPPEGKKVRGAFEDLGITEETVRTETGRTVDELLEKEDEDTSVVRTDGIDGLEHVTLKVKRIDPETVKGDVNETVEAIEAQAETERAREAEKEIRREAIGAFRESVERGENSVENVLTLCGAVYEGNEAQVNEIIAEIEANPDMAPEEVKLLTDRCLALCDADETPVAAEGVKIAETAEKTAETDAETYKGRIDRTPVKHGKWTNAEGGEGVRGESKFVPESESVRATLSEYGVDGIEYREGLPDFAPVSSFDAYLDPEDYEASDPEQFEMCILALQEEVIEDPDTGEIPNPELAAHFTEDQLIDIAEGITPEGYTWHHDAEAGHLQLVPTDVHQACRHAGGRSIWGGGAKARTAGRRSGE